MSLIDFELYFEELTSRPMVNLPSKTPEVLSNYIRHQYGYMRHAYSVARPVASKWFTRVIKSLVYITSQRLPKVKNFELYQPQTFM